MNRLSRPPSGYLRQQACCAGSLSYLVVYCRRSLHPNYTREPWEFSRGDDSQFIMLSNILAFRRKSYHSGRQTSFSFTAVFDLGVGFLCMLTSHSLVVANRPTSTVDGCLGKGEVYKCPAPTARGWTNARCKNITSLATIYASTPVKGCGVS
ncbi:hypothetical protein B0H66DRAFT_544939 [Apodospora peruviana]|uniref:Uncharacterized protein n=1 Tax=Apodospora peruviana TaxID=516989 RepID=A0AAE0ITR8_9PEZI|nr:hypothetical protein B0H66DRAFT_544939 [Apodospora peruviana]